MSSYLLWNVSPEIFTLPFLGTSVRWYGLLFASGLLGAYWILKLMVIAEKKSVDIYESLVFYVMVATVIGARLGHVLIYNPEYYFSNPLKIFYIWEGGLTSHGGFFCVILALYLYSRRHKEEFSFLWLADRAAIAGMFTAGCIRLGNLFNSEIVGVTTDVPWGFVFVRNGESFPRHPTQIYESLGYFYICLMFYLIYRYKGRQIGTGRMFGAVMVAGFSHRFIVEFFKENHKEFVRDLPLNMGQMLSIPFILVGLFFLLGLHHKFNKPPSSAPGAESSKTSAPVTSS